jgi:GNAT superfamily N-acetyltransferase
MEEQLSLVLNYGDGITKICELKRSNTPLTSQVEIDSFTQEASKNFDYDFDGINKFYPFEIPKMLEELDFNILCIVGASGSGKSTFSKYFGEPKNIEWDNTKAIISNFENVDDAIEKLNSVGLNSIPTWCKPRNVLSVAEGFRVDLAKQIQDNCVIDEFTSTIDRNVALSCCNSIQKYIRKKDIKKCVFVSCHKDFIDTLKPDYVIDLDDECIYDTRRLPKRNFELSIYETKAKESVWRIFRHHHYLSKELNYASRVFVAYLNDEIVGMIAILPLPNGAFKNAFRIHRLVILPDYQGLGIGSKLIEYFANLHCKIGCGFYIRTSHVKLHTYFSKKENWIETVRSGKKSPKQDLWYMDDDRTPYSYKYVGEYNPSLDKNDVILYNIKEEQQDNVEYLSLF